MASLGNLYFKIGADVREAVSGINKIEREVSNFSRSLGSIGKIALGGATFAGLASVVKEALVSAAKLETTFLKIKNLTDSSAADLSLFRSSIGGISKTLGVATNDLANGLYNITSSGLTGAKALETLEISAKGAAVGMGTTDEIAKALTGTLNAYSGSNLSAAKAAEIFFKTTKSGALDIAELTSSMSNVTPLAAALGVNLEQVGAFLATVSLKGTGASEAVTQLASILNAIINPTSEAKKIMDSIGLSMDQLQAMIKSDFRGAMLELEKGFDGSAEKMAKFFGRKEAVIGFLSVVGASAGKYGDILKDLQTNTSLLEDATNDAMNTLEGRWNRALAVWKNALTTLGDILATITLIPSEIVRTIKELKGLFFPEAQQDINRLKEINDQAKQLENINKGLTLKGADPKSFNIPKTDDLSQFAKELDKIFDGLDKNQGKKLKVVTSEELAQLDLFKLKTQEIFDTLQRAVDLNPLTNFEKFNSKISTQFKLDTPTTLPTERLKEVVSQTDEGIQKVTQSLDKSWNEFISKGEQANAVAQAVGQASADAFFNLGSALVEGASGFKALGLAALDAASQIIRAALAAAIAEAIAKSVKKSPNILIGLALAAVAIGAVKALFTKVPKLAQGGLAYRKQLAIVGDNPNAASDPEVISPLSKLNSLLANQINNLAGLLTRSFNQSIQAVFAQPTAIAQPSSLDFRDPLEIVVKGKIDGSDIRLAYDRAESIRNRHLPKPR